MDLTKIVNAYTVIRNFKDALLMIEDLILDNNIFGAGIGIDRQGGAVAWNPVRAAWNHLRQRQGRSADIFRVARRQSAASSEGDSAPLRQGLHQRRDRE
jgi:hypothetical protein